MSLVNKLLSASGGVDKLYVDDVFSAYTYTGNGGTQTINNVIDLAGKGGLVWQKMRSGGSASALNHCLSDSARGATQSFSTNTTGGTYDYGSTNSARVTSFNSDGFTFGNNQNINESGTLGVAWTFRKAPKFFDVVTYTGDDTYNRPIPHDLGITPGMVVIKSLSASGDWNVRHIGAGSSSFKLNTTDAGISGFAPYSTDITSTIFKVTKTNETFDSFNTNRSGVQYVAYLFAHDPSADGIVQCGSFTTDASGKATVNLGWEPQFLIYKKTDNIGNWSIGDTARGLSQGADDLLFANTSNASQQFDFANPSATGFNILNGSGNNNNFIYIAIRRSNKPPTLGTEVYNAIARTGTGAAATVTGVGFAPDLVIAKLRAVATITYGTFDRLRGRQSILETTTTAAEQNLSTATQDLTSFDMDGISVGVVSNSNINWSPQPIINYFFKRAVGVFDEVCYTGTGSARTVQHGLGVVPELIIVKSRSASALWLVYSNFIGNTQYGVLNATDSFTTGGLVWNNTSPTEQSITLGTFSGVNTNSDRYVAYLFASKAGISKVFSYTGNGTSQTIDCGFTTGARFIMVKRTDSTGDWMISDSIRGIVASSDPRLSLNTTAAEITTDDWLDPDGTGSGFIVNQTAASNANVSGASYIGLSFA
jgi:hypothetical protein